MTRIQIEQIRDAMRLVPNSNPGKKAVLLELDAREMANSCICYGEDSHFFNERTGAFGDAAERYFREGIPAARLQELFREQKAEITAAGITHGVYTDGEGCTYNSIDWKDEPADGRGRLAARIRRTVIEEAADLLQETLAAAARLPEELTLKDRAARVAVTAALQLLADRRSLRSFAEEDGDKEWYRTAVAEIERYRTAMEKAMAAWREASVIP